MLVHVLYYAFPHYTAVPSSCRFCSVIRIIYPTTCLLATLFVGCCSDTSRQYVTWVDNYSHVYHKTVIRCSQLDYVLQMWTVEARCLLATEAGPVDMSLRRSDGVIVPLMPAEMFDYTDIAVVLDSVVALTAKFEYDSSLCVKWSIRSTPPKPDLKKLSDQQRTRATVQSQFLSRIVPVQVHEFNVGSNAGLCRYMRMLQDQITAAPHDDRYHVLVVDVNIFERALKVASPRSPHFTSTVCARLDALADACRSCTTRVVPQRSCTRASRLCLVSGIH